VQRSGVAFVPTSKQKTKKSVIKHTLSPKGGGDKRGFDIKIIYAGVLFPLLMGCTATSLQCGVDGDSSFVNLNSTPATISQNSRNLAELCGFAYEAEKS